jgi:hypothetical protein
MREIGGYLELECYGSAPFHKGGILLNSARNALRWFVRNKGIRKIHTPRYTCPVVCAALKAENCTIEFYDIGIDWMPTQEFPKEDWLLWNNYFGICDKQASELASKYPNLVLDNAQAFYAAPIAVANIYSPRKFFGLPDGGILVCHEFLPLPEETDVSHQRASHLLMRHDLGANAAFAEFQKNDSSLENEPVRRMSKLTQNLSSNINYEQAKQKRIQNFDFLSERLDGLNGLKFSKTEGDVPLAYPFLTKNPNLRKALIANKIYVATYWPGVKPPFEGDLLPLPIDQRYGTPEMERIVEALTKENK